jgi:hypothetical protein
MTSSAMRGIHVSSSAGASFGGGRTWLVAAGDSLGVKQAAGPHFNHEATGSNLSRSFSTVPSGDQLASSGGIIIAGREYGSAPYHRGAAGAARTGHCCGMMSGRVDR